MGWHRLLCAQDKDPWALLEEIIPGSCNDPVQDSQQLLEQLSCVPAPGVPLGCLAPEQALPKAVPLAPGMPL